MPNNTQLGSELIHCAIDRDSAMGIFQALQEHARTHGIALRQPPPEPTTCCGRGCNGCVWESYFDAATFWQEDALLALVATGD